MGNLKRKLVGVLCLFTVMCGFSFGMVGHVAADTSSDAACAALTGVSGPSACTSEAVKSSGASLSSTIRLIVNILATIAGVVAVIVVIIAGMRYVLSRGSPEAVASASRQFAYAIVGLMVVVIASTLVHFVLSRIVIRDDSRTAAVAALSAADAHVSELKATVAAAEQALEAANASGDQASIDQAQAVYDQAISELDTAVADADTATTAAQKAGAKTTTSSSKKASKSTAKPGTKQTTKQTPADDNFRIVTFNTRFDVPASATVKDIRRIVDDNADIIGLQEMSNDAHAMAIKNKFVSCPSCDFGAYMPRGNAAVSEYVIMWRKDKFKLTDEGTMVAAAGNWSWVKQGMHINWVKLQSKETGRSLYLLDNHLPAHVEVNGSYRAGVPDRIRAYGLYMDTITNFMQQHGTSKTPVFAVGDFNVDFRRDPAIREPDFPVARMRKIGANSNYQALGTTRLGTHVTVSGTSCTDNKHSVGARIIDYVFKTNLPGLSFQGQHVIETSCSDHNAVSVLMHWAS